MRVARWLRQNPLVPAACGLVAGVSGPLWAAVAMGLGLGLVFWQKFRTDGKTGPESGLGHLPLLMVVLAAAGCLRAILPGPALGLPAVLPGARIIAEGQVGQVFTPPPGAGMRAWFVLNGKIDGTKLRLRIQPAEGETPPLPGSQVRVSGIFRPPDRPTNPWQWDEAARFAEKGIAGKIWVPDDLSVEMVRPPPWWHAMAWGERGRRAIAEGFARNIPDIDQRAVVLGIALGMREGMGEDTLLAFRRTGSLHLFAVSGMHVGMLVGIFWLILEAVPLERRRLVWVVLPLVLAYAVLTGWEPPAVRAAAMISIFLLGLALDRTPRIMNSLAAAFILLVLADPSQRLDLGFQLTFSVVLAIVLLGIPLARKLSFLGQPDPFLPADLVTPGQRRWWRGVRLVVASLCFGLAANLGSLPLSLHHFNLATPSGVVLGLVLVPLSWLILALALAMSPVALLGPGWLAGVLGTLAGKLAALCISLCAWAAGLPGAWHLPRHDPDSPMEILVFDLDRGGASALARTSRAAWLVDSGNPGHAKQIIGPAAVHFGTAPVDLLIQTHEDVQHRGGTPNLQSLLGPPSAWWEKPRVGHRASTGGMTAEILFPPVGWAADRADDRAAILRLATGPWRLLWVGDAGFTAQKWLLEHSPAPALRAEVLCVGWHQSDIGLLREFVDAVQPRLVIWHRWRPETLNPPGPSLRAHLKNRGIALMEQSWTGAITLALDPDRLTATPFLPVTAPVVLEILPTREAPR